MSAPVEESEVPLNTSTNSTNPQIICTTPIGSVLFPGHQAGHITSITEPLSFNDTLITSNSPLIPPRGTLMIIDDENCDVDFHSVFASSESDSANTSSDKSAPATMTPSDPIRRLSQSLQNVSIDVVPLNSHRQERNNPHVHQSMSTLTQSSLSRSHKALSIPGTNRRSRQYDNVESKVRTYIDNIKQKKTRNRSERRMRETPNIGENINVFTVTEQPEDLLALKEEIKAKNNYIYEMTSQYHELQFKLSEEIGKNHQLRFQLTKARKHSCVDAATENNNNNGGFTQTVCVNAVTQTSNDDSVEEVSYTTALPPSTTPTPTPSTPQYTRVKKNRGATRRVRAAMKGGRINQNYSLLSSDLSPSDCKPPRKEKLKPDGTTKQRKSLGRAFAEVFTICGRSCECKTNNNNSVCSFGPDNPA